MSKCKFHKQCKHYQEDSYTCNRLAGFKCGQFQELFRNEKVETCKCGGDIIHPSLYYYECKKCGLKYQIDPASSKPITILQESNFQVIKK